MLFLLQPSAAKAIQKPIRLTEKEVPLELTSSASPEQHWHYCTPVIHKLVKCLTLLLFASCQFNAFTGASNVPRYPLNLIAIPVTS